jgi:formiminotetrahydrofolate cyclodeaminase
MAIKDQKIEDFLDDLASKKPTPGGGATAALAGAMAASLVSMVAKLSMDKDKEFKEIERKADRLRKELLELADEDCQVYEGVMETYRTDKKELGRLRKIQKALKKAAEVPLKTAQKSVEVVKLVSFCAREGNQNAISDARVGVELATAAVYSALENVRINLESIKDSKFNEDVRGEIDDLLECEDLKSG